MVRTLVVTNDLPPRTGGIQTFLHEVLRRQDPSDIVVFGPRQSGSETFDASAGYEIHRNDGPIIPTPWVAKRAAEVAAVTGASQVMFGSGMPNAHLIPFLRRLGLPTALVITHGNEAGWAQLPVGRALVYPLNGARSVTYLGPFTHRILSKYVKPASRLHRLPPGVDTERFRPGSGGAELRESLGITDRFVIGTVSRFVPRKGVDLLIQALPFVRRSIPDAVLLVAGDGPRRNELQALATSCDVSDHVLFIGAPAADQLPAVYDAMDVFALPTHTRKFGVDVEGLGIVFLEAAASGVPVLVGASGGSVDAVRPGETGQLINTDPPVIAARIVELARNDAARQAMGVVGRQWMIDDWEWSDRATRVRELLRAH
jgi:phosphatidylinositol alpha-1,6-mannosyltransferase